MLLSNKLSNHLVTITLIVASLLAGCGSDPVSSDPPKSAATLELESTPGTQFDESFCEDFAEFEENFCNNFAFAVAVKNRIQPFRAPGGGDGPTIRSSEYFALELASEEGHILVSINMYPDTAVISRVAPTGELGYVLENESTSTDASVFDELLYDLVDARTVTQAQAIASSHLGTPSQVVNDEDEQATARVAVYTQDAMFVDEPDGPEGAVLGCTRGERNTIYKIMDYLSEAGGYQLSASSRTGLYFAIRDQMRNTCGDEFRENDCLGCIPNIGCALTGAFTFLADELNGNQLAQIVDKLLVDLFNFTPGVAAAALAEDPDLYSAALTELFYISAVEDSEDCLLIRTMFDGVVRDLLLGTGVPYQNSLI